MQSIYSWRAAHINLQENATFSHEGVKAAAINEPSQEHLFSWWVAQTEFVPKGLSTKHTLHGSDWKPIYKAMEIFQWNSQLTLNQSR